MKDVINKSQSERRDYFRIDDVTILYHKVLSGADATDTNVADKLSVDRLTLKARFDALNRELRPLQQTIKNDYPSIARYLEAIDKKIDMISEILVETEIDDMSTDPQVVNLSAGGVSFVSQQPMSNGSVLAIRVVLLPDNLGIYSRAEVISCNEFVSDNTKSYKISVKFTDLDEEMQDLISRHVLSKQRESLGKATIK